MLLVKPAEFVSGKDGSHQGFECERTLSIWWVGGRDERKRYCESEKLIKNLKQMACVLRTMDWVSHGLTER